MKKKKEKEKHHMSYVVKTKISSFVFLPFPLDPVQRIHLIKAAQANAECNANTPPFYKLATFRMV
jgi:hypothetical protein